MAQVNFTAIIPARMGSTRLANKILVDIAGKPMIRHVIDRVKASGAARVVVATDTQEIFDCVAGYQTEAVMTDKDHPTGTDRVAEACRLLKLADDEIVANIQGDEPLMSSKVIRQVALGFPETNADVATACQPISLQAQIFSPHIVKVVFDKLGNALYFSRAPIAWDLKQFALMPETIESPWQHYRHLGIYVYRVGFLQKYVNLEVSPLERAESLEQLRILWHGGRIHVANAVEACIPGIDTEEDLQRVRKHFNEQQSVMS